MKEKIFTLAVVALTLIACNSNEKNMKAGIDPTNLDTSVRPEVDFYEYACGGWRKNNPLTDEYARLGAFDKLNDNNREQIKGLIDKLATSKNEKGSVAQKIGDLYNLAMDSARLNEEGYTPVIPSLERVSQVGSKEELLAIMPELMLEGVFPLFSPFVSADPMNSSQNILNLLQGGLSLPNRDYYIDTDEESINIRSEYKKYIVDEAQLFGYTKEEAEKMAEDVMRIETRLANSHLDKVALRDPYANYHKMSLDELSTLVPEIDWRGIFDGLAINASEVNVGQKEPLAEAGKLFGDESLDALKSYIEWHIIDGATPYLSDEIYARSFDFHDRVLTGVSEMKPRWKRAQGSLSMALGEAIGEIYVAEYFPPEAKERVMQLVKNLQAAYKERIENLDWMSDTTKAKAIEKLDAFYVKIGYPDKWRDYTSLEIDPSESYYANTLRARHFLIHEEFEKAGKPVDKDEWEMTPQTVNAYYNPSTNEICFPAGILQYPFFDKDADDAFNYGAIGVVIGHEMTHGFDDQGRQFDKDGNLNDWWTPTDAEKFKTKAAVMSDFFDSIEVAPGVHANGKFTLGETLADYGGLQISWQAYKNATAGKTLEDKEGFTPDQRFFLAYAGVWAGNIRHEEILRLTKIDTHALGRWRVNGELPHTDMWYEAFNIDENSPMYIPPEQRVTIW